MERAIREQHIGGVILFDQEMAEPSLRRRNIESPQQVRALITYLQAQAAHPLLIAVDQEGGRVNRLKPEYGFPTAADLLQRYATKCESELSQIEWYIAFGYFKLAVILEGIYLRFSQGQTVGPGFAEIGPLVEPLVSCGHHALRGE